MRKPYLAKVDWAGTAIRVLARISGAPAEGEIEVVLIERDGDRRLPFPVLAVPGAGPVGEFCFESSIDVAKGLDGGPLPIGLWDVHVATGDVAVGLGANRAPDLHTMPQRHFLNGSPTVTTYFGLSGGLAIDVGGQPHAVGSTQLDSVAWDAEGETVVVQGHIDFADHAMPISATLTLRERTTRKTFEVIAMLDTESVRLDYTAQIPMTRAIIDDPLPRGEWDAFLILGFSGLHRELLVLGPAQSLDRQVWRRMRHARIRTAPGPGPFGISVR